MGGNSALEAPSKSPLALRRVRLGRRAAGVDHQPSAANPHDDDFSLVSWVGHATFDRLFCSVVWYVMFFVLLVAGGTLEVMAPDIANESSPALGIAFYVAAQFIHGTILCLQTLTYSRHVTTMVLRCFEFWYLAILTAVLWVCEAVLLWQKTPHIHPAVTVLSIPPLVFTCTTIFANDASVASPMFAAVSSVFGLIYFAGRGILWKYLETAEHNGFALDINIYTWYLGTVAQSVCLSISLFSVKYAVRRAVFRHRLIMITLPATLVDVSNNEEGRPPLQADSQPTTAAEESPTAAIVAP